jgi:PAS domain S-box-containing protein
VRDSGVRQFRRPPRVQPNRRDAELAALVANIPGAIYRCALDRNYTMAMISDEIERISGYPASDFILNRARSFVSVIHPDDRADVEREIADATSEDRPFALEYRIVRADGSVAWVLERGQLVVDADEQVSLHGVVFDISERKRAEDSFAAVKPRRRGSPSWKLRGRGSSPLRTRPAGRSSATSTTGRSNDW